MKRALYCALCGRKLTPGRYVYSKATKQRYCFPGRCLKKARSVPGQ